MIMKAENIYIKSKKNEETIIIIIVIFFQERNIGIHVVLCLAYLRERMVYQNSSSNPYIVLQWCSDTIREITSVVISQMVSLIFSYNHYNYSLPNFLQFLFTSINMLTKRSFEVLSLKPI